MGFHQCSNAQTRLVAKVITIIITRQGGLNQGNQGFRATFTFFAEQREKNAWKNKKKNICLMKKPL